MIRFYTNAPEVADAFRRIGLKIGDVAPPIYKGWESVLDGAVLPATPVDTGYLKSQIHAEFDKTGNVIGFEYGVWDKDCDYAKFVEYAWGGRSAFFWKAVDSAVDEMADVAWEVIKDACSF